jgi:hypothetical protein
VDAKGRTALHWAAKNGNQQAVLGLLEAGAEVHAKDKKGRTAMQLAKTNHFENKPLSMTLIAWGADQEKKSALNLELLSRQSKLTLARAQEIKVLSMREAAAKGGFTGRMADLLKNPALGLRENETQKLLRMARENGHHETAAVIQSAMACQAVDEVILQAGEMSIKPAPHASAKRTP